MNERFLRLPEVTVKVGLSKSQIYKMIKEGAFPSMLKVCGRVSVWSEAQIHEWMGRVSTLNGNGYSHITN